MKKRLISVHDYSAGKYFRFLEEFLGSKDIERRFSSIDLELKTEKGIYLEKCVLQKRAWWLGFREARKIIKRGDSFKRVITPLMQWPLQTAVKLYKIYSSIPTVKRNEIKSRILTDDILNPTIFEIDCATHYWMLGYDIDWSVISSPQGIRSPEFIAIKGENSFEVECKSKLIDSGRSIERASFYRALDSFYPVFIKKSLSGIIFLKVPSIFPSQDSWRVKATGVIEKEIKAGETTITLPDGERFECSLHEINGRNVTDKDITTIVDAVNHPYMHYAIIGSRTQGAVIDPIIFRLESEKNDVFLNSILLSLKNAVGQFTGKRTSLINCFIPEIETFDGFQSNSAIKNMTNFFFEKYAKPYIYSVTYVSDPRRNIQGLVINTDMPSITFRNYKYDPSFGPDIPIYG